MTAPTVEARVSAYDLKGGDTLTDRGDVVLSVNWGRTKARAVVVEVMRPDKSSGRRYFADGAYVEVSRDAVSTITAEELLKTFAHLTHRMHEVNRDGDHDDAERKVRAERDLVQAEILRRMGEGR